MEASFEVRRYHELGSDMAGEVRRTSSHREAASRNPQSLKADLVSKAAPPLWRGCNQIRDQATLGNFRDPRCPRLGLRRDASALRRRVWTNVDPWSSISSRTPRVLHIETPGLICLLGCRGMRRFSAWLAPLQQTCGSRRIAAGNIIYAGLSRARDWFKLSTPMYEAVSSKGRIQRRLPAGPDRCDGGHGPPK
jgi:hypothetical protein